MLPIRVEAGLVDIVNIIGQCLGDVLRNGETAGTAATTIYTESVGEIYQGCGGGEEGEESLSGEHFGELVTGSMIPFRVVLAMN